MTPTRNKLIIREKESNVQKAIIDYLRLKGYYVYKNVSVGTYNKKTDRYIPMSTKGIADLTAIKKGQVYQVEVKVGGKHKQSAHQKQFQEDWESHGGVYILGNLEAVMFYVR